MSTRKRTYAQYCPLARTLDLVGERWTLLIVRELMAGPKRYSDVLGALPGIGTSLLATRLKNLETDGVVRRRELPPPAASAVYELTDTGEELADAILPLAFWGIRHRMGDKGRREGYRAEWPLLVIQSLMDEEDVRDLQATWEFRIDDSIAHVRVDRGDVSVRSGPAEHADVVLTSDATTFVDVGTGRGDAAAAAAEGRFRIEGERDAVSGFLRVMQRVVEGVQAPAHQMRPRRRASRSA